MSDQETAQEALSRQARDLQVISQLTSLNPDTVERAVRRQADDYRAIRQFIPRRLEEGDMLIKADDFTVSEENALQAMDRNKHYAKQRMYKMLADAAGVDLSPGFSLGYYSQWGNFQNHSWTSINPQSIISKHVNAEGLIKKFVR